MTRAISCLSATNLGTTDAPVLRWIDDKNLSVDLGKVTWLTPQIDHLGHVKISYSYSGAEPSLE
jgi:hypothetical protein